MNIIFIIGNGFDINLGVKSRYTDFYNSYILLPSKSKAIQTLKENISGDLKNWSDLELAIGNYTQYFNTVEEFLEVFEDIGDNLGEYLLRQEEIFPFERVEKANIYTYLSFPEQSLTRADLNSITNYKSNWASNDWIVRIITLNYTKIFERMLGRMSNNIEIGKHHNHAIRLRTIEHLHGFSDDGMVMGVNDLHQIVNQSFHNSLFLREALVKPDCNKASKSTIDEICKEQIISADLIFIFGSSIGDTDNYWWQLIGEQLKRGCQLVIFTIGEEISRRWGYKKAQKEREMKNYFFSKTNLSDEEKINLINNIYIGVNSDLFSKILK